MVAIATGPQKLMLIRFTPETKYYEIYKADESSLSWDQKANGYTLFVSMDQEKCLYSGTDQEAALAAVKKQAQE